MAQNCKNLNSHIQRKVNLFTELSDINSTKLSGGIWGTEPDLPDTHFKGGNRGRFLSATEMQMAFWKLK